MSDNVLKTFTDKKGRTIEIVDDVGSIKAKFEGKEIGCFNFSNIDGEILAETIDVNEGYKAAGIGLKMVEAAFEAFGMIRVPNPNPMESSNRITTEGLILWAAAQKKGFCYPVWERPNEEHDEKQDCDLRPEHGS